METYELGNRVRIPKIGFGTWQIPEGDEAYQSVLHALKVGYRHIDTAQVYGNETSVGRAIADSGIPRSEIFLTTKIWNDKHDYELAKASMDESMQKLQVDYLDLILIHWPNPKELRDKGFEAWKAANQSCWKAMEEYYEAGKVRAIGVSNFMVHHLESLLETCQTTPMVNQIMLAPGTIQEELVNFCREKGILVEAYSPLGTGTLFENATIHEIAQKYQKNPAQVALRWSLQKGFLPLPKSVTPQHIQSNLEIFDFELSEDDIQLLDQLEGLKSQKDPDIADF